MKFALDKRHEPTSVVSRDREQQAPGVDRPMRRRRRRAVGLDVVTQACDATHARRRELETAASGQRCDRGVRRRE